jgi:hypothetical protein
MLNFGGVASFPQAPVLLNVLTAPGDTAAAAIGLLPVAYTGATHAMYQLQLRATGAGWSSTILLLALSPTSRFMSTMTLGAASASAVPAGSLPTPNVLFHQLRPAMQFEFRVQIVNDVRKSRCCCCCCCRRRRAAVVVVCQV